MKSTLRTLILTCGIVVSPLAMPDLNAQIVDLGQVQREGVQAMRTGDWNAAYKVFANATEKMDKNAMVLYGPKFGYFWYHKGYCELKLKKYSEAAESFEVCYSRYANKPDTPSDRRNFYHIKALLKWGDALRGDKDYDGALKKYEKFLAERDKERDKFNPGELYLGMAVCNFQKEKPDFAEGIEKMRSALDNKERFKVVDYEILVCFNFFCDGLMGSEKKIAEKEQIFADFMKEYRDDIALDPYLMVQYSPMITKLSFEAAGSDLNEMSARLAGLLPESSYAASQTKAQVEAMSTRKFIKDGRQVKSREFLSNQVATLKAQLEKDSVVDASSLMMVGNHAANLGNYRAAYGAFLQLEQLYDKHEKREDNLFQLVQLTAVLNEVLLTEKYGTRFLKAFPESGYAEKVRGMMLGSLFAAGKYELCIEVATRMLPSLQEGSEQHDTCLHVLGGSNYYLGKFVEAEPDLNKHFELYVADESKKSSNALASSYFHAANPSRLQDYDKSNKLLTAFLDKYPKPSENIYMPFARYDLANCKFQLDDKKAALELLESIEKDFPGSSNMQSVYVLKGTVLDTLKEREQAEEAYIKGLELAKKREDDFVASEALYNLVRLLGEERKDGNPDMQRAVPYYEEFFANYPNSPFRPETAVAGVPAMGSVDRLDEALERLQSVIVELGKTGSRGYLILEQALTSYKDAYLLKHSPDELRVHFFDFPGVSIEDTELRALLSIAVIGVYEELAEAARVEKDQDKLTNAEAAVKVQFERLRKDFKPDQLTNFVAIRLGEYLRTKTNSPRESLVYFDRVLTNPDDKAFTQEARFGKADVLGRSDSVAENDQALEILRGLLADESLDRGKVAEANYRVVKVLEQKGDWAGVQKATLQYLDDRANKFKRPEVAYLHAIAFKEQGKVDEALNALLKFNAAHASYVKFSAPAMLLFIDLMEKRGKLNENGKTDLQIAYENAWVYWNGMNRNTDKMSSEDLGLFQEVADRVKQLEQSGLVKTMEQIKAEKQK